MRLTKIVTISFVIILLGAVVIPATCTSSVSPEKVDLLCEIYLPDGYRAIEKEIAKKDLHLLFNLMDSEDNKKFVHELRKLGLMPDDVSEQTLVNILDGKYNEQIRKMYDKVGKAFLIDSSYGYVNVFCKVEGEAEDIWFERLSEKIILTAGAIIISFITLLAEYAPLLALIFAIPIFTILSFLLDIFLYLDHSSGLRLKILTNAVIYLNTFAKVDTRGLLGKWKLEKDWIKLCTIGFTGVILHTSKSDLTTFPKDKLKGYSIFLSVV